MNSMFASVPVADRPGYEMQRGPSSVAVHYRSPHSVAVAFTGRHYMGRLDPASVRWEGPWMLRGFGDHDYQTRLLDDVQRTLATAGPATD